MFQNKIHTYLCGECNASFDLCPIGAESLPAFCPFCGNPVLAELEYYSDAPLELESEWEEEEED